MSDILEVIRNRRSIRQYQENLPRDTDIEKILEAGRWAPSGLNNQPWRFLVIKDKTTKDGLAKFTKYAKIVRAAPVLLLIFLNSNDSYERDKDLMAIGACIQNMLLQAHSLGLASCWLGEILNQKVEVQSYLRVDKDCELMAVVALGYTAQDIKEGCRKPLWQVVIEPNKRKVQSVKRKTSA